MSSHAKGDPFCLECHWETFHIDGKDAADTPDANLASQWECLGEAHHRPSLQDCDVDEACCDVDDCEADDCEADDCSVDCPSVCDGFVDCDEATACTDAHCDDQNCGSTDPACFDDHCFGGCDGVDHGLESLLGLGPPLPLETNDLLPPATVDHSQIDHTVKTTDHVAPTTVNPHHCTHGFFPPYSTSTNHGHFHSPAHHFDCHGFPRPTDGNNITHPSYPIQNEVNPADVFHMLGMCSDFSVCNDYHVHPQQNDSQNSLNKLNETPSSVPFSCFHPGHHHMHDPVENPASPSLGNTHTTHVNGPCRSHHRCRHTHAHSHPYSPYTRHSRSSVSSHLLSSPGETPPPLDAATSSSVLTSPEFSPVDRAQQHICKWSTSRHGVTTVCGTAFANAGALQDHLVSNHMKTIDGAKGNGYYCCWEGCHRPDEPFSQKSKLQGHFLTHSNHKNFKCAFCEKVFARQATLDRHERSHRGEKPYKCDKCGKTFTDSSELKTHSRTHSGEKPFKCTFPGCNFQTGDSSNMSSHRLTHGERRHKCHFIGCTKSFTRHDQLKRHLKTTHKLDSSAMPSPLSDDFLPFSTIV